MKKVKYLMVTCLTIALFSFGVVAFANSGTNTESNQIKSEAIVGKFVALENENSKIKVSLESGVETYLVDKAVWVLLDKKKAGLENLQMGDKLEFTFNASNKVAYIKAYSEAFLKAEAAALVATPAPTLAPMATLAPVATVKPTPTATPKVIKPIHKVKTAKKVDAALKADKDKADCDDKFDGKDNEDNKENENHKDKGNDHRQDKDNKHNSRNNHDMKKSS